MKMRDVFLCSNARALCTLFVVFGTIALQSCNKDEDPVAAPSISIDRIFFASNDGSSATEYNGRDAYDKVVVNKVLIGLGVGESNARVEIFIDNLLVATLISEPYQFVWDSHTVKNGYYTIKAVATNAAGNSQTAQTRVKVENNP